MPSATNGNDNEALLRDKEALVRDKEILVQKIFELIDEKDALREQITKLTEVNARHRAKIASMSVKLDFAVKDCDLFQERVSQALVVLQDLPPRKPQTEVDDGGATSFEASGQNEISLDDHMSGDEIPFDRDRTEMPPDDYATNEETSSAPVDPDMPF